MVHYSPPLRELRPSAGDPIYRARRSGRSVGKVGEVISRVAFPCRWFVYDLRGEGYPVEPRTDGGWVEVVEG